MTKRSAIFLSVIFFLAMFRTATAQTDKFDSSVYAINDYVTSSRFYKIRLEQGELAAIDSVYLFALKFFNEDFSETLLSLTFSLLPFNKMNLSLPFRQTLTLRLPSVETPLYKKRLESLPRGFLADSPIKPNSDTDKLAHFFGNAFLGYNLNLFNIAEFLGIFVESFEMTFKIDGAFDERDLKVNKLGYFFGETLRENKNVLPSEFFIFYSLTFITDMP